jgi:hypothetical protein
VTSLPAWFALIVAPLGVARAVWLVMSDRITAPWRNWMERKGGYAAYFVQCPWCVSMWVAGITVALLAWDVTAPVVEWLLFVGALSIFAVLSERVIDRTPMLEDKPVHGTLPDHRAEAPDAVRAALDTEE